MLFVIAIGGLVLLSVIHWLFARYHPRFKYDWHLGIAGGLAVWVLVLIAGLQLPAQISFFTWQPESLFPSSPALLADRLSWPLVIGLATLLLLILLTSPLRMESVNHNAWAGNFGLAAAGMIAVLSANPLSLVMAWSAIDLIELAILLRIVKSIAARRRLLMVLSFRTLGTGFFLIPLMLNPAGNTFADFAGIPTFQNLLLLLAVSLRLGVIPVTVSFLHEHPLRRGLGSSLRFVPAVASMVALARTAGGELPGLWVNILLGLTLLAGFYAALTWLAAKDDIEGRMEWVLGMSALALVAHILNQPEGVVIFGVVMVLGGGLLFLTTIRNRRSLLLQVITVVMSLGLPYTITWASAGIFSQPFPWLALLTLPLHAAYLVGYLNQARKPVESTVPHENWRVFLGYLGILTGFCVYVLLGVWNLRDGARYASWPGVVALVMVILFAVILRRWSPALPDRFSDGLRTIFSFGWAYRVFAAASSQVANGVYFMNRILEGEAGILWALLLLVMILAALGQAGL